MKKFSLQTKHRFSIQSLINNMIFFCLIILLTVQASCETLISPDTPSSVTIVDSTATQTPGNINTPLPTDTYTLTPTSTIPPSHTSSPEPTSTDTPTPSSTPQPTSTPTFTPSPTNTPTYTPTSTPTHTPTITPTSTSELEDTFDFKELVYYPPGGGTVEFCLRDSQSETDESRVFVTRLAEKSFNQTRLCAINYPKNKLVTLRIYTPDGNLTAVFEAKARSLFIDDPRNVSINLPTLPVDLPVGKWQIVAQSGNLIQQASFQHPDKRTYFTIRHEVPENQNALNPFLFKAFKRGENVIIEGTNYPPETAFPLGIYREKGSSHPVELQPVTGKIISTDSLGNFSAKFKIDKKYIPGTNYYVFLVDKPDIVEFSTGEMNFATFKVYEPTKPCKNAQESNFQNGDWGIVAPGPPNNVRNGSGTGKEIIGKLFEFSLFFITDGPKCNNKMVWWKIRNNDLGLEGWTAEGANGEEWLLPLQ